MLQNLMATKSTATALSPTSNATAIRFGILPSPASGRTSALSIVAKVIITSHA
ncbi:MAG: hypothetical protein KJ015_40595 [Myxococcales bacterium]|nr:hypothetical protein [Myxococcales bacterium]